MGRQDQGHHCRVGLLPRSLVGQDPFEEPELFQLALSAQHGGVPCQAQMDAEGGLGGAVTGHIAHHHMDAAVLAAHHVAEVTAQQRVRAAWCVVEGGREALATQSEVGQQPRSSTVLSRAMPS